MTQLVGYLLSAGGLVFALAAVAAWIWRRPHSRLARRALFALAIGYTILASYAVSDATGRLLVAGYRPLSAADVPAGTAAIVVLGSGSITARDWDERRFASLDRASTSRVLEAARVFRLADAAWVVSSGGLVRPSDVDEPNGATMRDALVRLGVPESRLLVETRSRNTRDEAVIVRELLAPLGIDHVILVTSELHMHRSLGAFRAVGIAAVPAIARQPRPDIPWFAWVIPSARGLAEAGDVWHEILGLAYYRARGWYRGQ